MAGRRIAVTGVGLATPIGDDLGAVGSALRDGRHGIVRRPEWDRVGDLATRLAGVCDVDLARRWPRKAVRSMGRVARLAAYATDRAVGDAGLDAGMLTSGRVGLAYGSTHGSGVELETFCRRYFANESLEGIASSHYLRFMSHTCAANLGQLYGIRGRVVSTSAACVSASQAVGAGFEAIRAGAEPVMICGGAEELHFIVAGVFDILNATSSRYNDRPGDSPRPFDRDRDGLVVAEGAGTLVLEDLDHARARGAHVHAEILGWGTNCDGSHVTSPSQDGMADCMRRALASAGVRPADVDYLNAHATGTRVGDVAESHATLAVMGADVPISSTKGNTGHTLGACGTIEAAFCIAMMRDGFLPANRNLDVVDPDCAALDYVRETRTVRPNVVMSNNFAFGGINTSIVLGPPP